VIKRGTPPSEGRWSVPGGMIELGETLQDAVKRELREECGIGIEVERVSDVESAIYYDEDKRVHFHYVVTYMIAYYTGGELRPGRDELDARWVERQELDGLDMHPAVRRNMIKAYEAVRTHEE
jgi:ADP-ribose pyrophosphatase YjhB (NUDIX family)